jgi:hypothetical protein
MNRTSDIARNLRKPPVDGPTGGANRIFISAKIAMVDSENREPKWSA